MLSSRKNGGRAAIKRGFKVIAVIFFSPRARGRIPVWCPSKWALALILGAFIACGSGNLFDCDNPSAVTPCSEKSPDEKARLALDRGDYDTAISILLELIEQEPEEYQRYTLLAAAYAARSGFLILDVLKSSFTGGNTNAFDAVSSFVPSVDVVGELRYADVVSDMGQAVASLKAIPEALRDKTSGEKYSKSADLQLSLYQSAYSVMYLNQFIRLGTDGKPDPEKLKSMSPEDALIVLENLRAAGALQGDGGNPELAGKIDSTLTAIDSAPGETSRDRLVNYVAISKGGSSVATSTMTATATQTLTSMATQTLTSTATALSP